VSGVAPRVHARASARAVAQNGHVDAGPANVDAAEQAAVAEHRPAAAQNTTAVVRHHRAGAVGPRAGKPATVAGTARQRTLAPRFG
jgi:hypothetical protein